MKYFIHFSLIAIILTFWSFNAQLELLSSHLSYHSCCAGFNFNTHKFIRRIYLIRSIIIRSIRLISILNSFPSTKIYSSFILLRYLLIHHLQQNLIACRSQWFHLTESTPLLWILVKCVWVNNWLGIHAFLECSCKPVFKFDS